MCQKKEKICAAYEEGTMTVQLCQKWFLKFCTGHVLLNLAPQLSIPVEVDN